MVNRYDIGTLRKPVKTSQGFLRVDANLTRTGIFSYRNADGTERRELRLPDQVFDASALESFIGAPVTDDHPSVMVTVDNVKDLAKGTVIETPKRDDNFVRATMLITDGGLIEKMSAGKTQVSCGYICDLDPTPGLYRGEKYDAVQVNIRGNHVAIVDVGRAGAECAARMDSGTLIQERQSMKAILVSGIKFDVEDALAQAYDAEVARLKGLADTATARADAIKSQLDASEKARTDAAAIFPAAVGARVALEKVAGGVLGGVSLESMTDRDVKAAVIAKVVGQKITADHSMEYVNGRYDGAVEQHSKANDGLSKARTVIDVADKSGAGEERKDVAAKKALNTRFETAWTKPIPGAQSKEGN